MEGGDTGRIVTTILKNVKTLEREKKKKKNEGGQTTNTQRDTTMHGLSHALGGARVPKSSHAGVGYVCECVCFSIELPASMVSPVHHQRMLLCHMRA